MKAGLVDRFGHHQAQATEHFGADRNPEQRHPAIGIVPFARRQHRRHDHRTGMHRTTLERIVEILAMRRGAVDEGGPRRRQRARMADRGARAVIVPACQ